MYPVANSSELFHSQTFLAVQNSSRWTNHALSLATLPLRPWTPFEHWLNVLPTQFNYFCFMLLFNYFCCMLLFNEVVIDSVMLLPNRNMLLLSLCCILLSSWKMLLHLLHVVATTSVNTAWTLIECLLYTSNIFKLMDKW